MGSHLPLFYVPLRGTGPMMPTLKTERLVLRPFRPEDAPAVLAHCGDVRVARMLTSVPHPYTLEGAENWIASHAAECRSGYGITFCIELDGEAIGAVGLRRNADGNYDLGYWLGESWWGKGFMTEAARRVVGFAFERLGAEKLTSGHFHDNPGSGRVLEKCGFRDTGESMVNCEARGEKVPQRNFELLPDEREARAGAS